MNDAGRPTGEWFMSSGRVAFWLACAGVGLFFLAAPAAAVAAGLGAAVLGAISAAGRGRKHGTANPVMGVCGLLLGLVPGSLALLVVPARAEIASRSPQAGADRAAARAQGSDPASVTCAGSTLTLRHPGPGWRIFPKGAGEFGDACDAHGVFVDHGDDARFVGLVISQPYEEDNVRKNGLANMGRNFLEHFNGLASKANQSVTEAELGGQPCAVCEMTGTVDSRPVRLRQTLVYWRGQLIQIRMLGGDTASFGDHARRFIDAVELVADPTGS